MKKKSLFSPKHCSSVGSMMNSLSDKERSIPGNTYKWKTLKKEGCAIEIFLVDEVYCFRTRNILGAGFKFVKIITKLEFLYRLNVSILILKS